MEYKWRIANKGGDFFGLGKILGVDPLIVRLLVNRGLKDEREMRQYLYGTISDICSPYLMKGMREGAELIYGELAAGSTIVVAADYDVDGVFSGELLYETFKNLGGRPILMTPNRIADGYGLNCRMVDAAASSGAGLIVTCDNGISSFEAVDYARSLGLKVVITDHHELAYDDGQERIYRLPAAEVVIDPKQGGDEYPCAQLCGCGVALMLAMALYEKAGRQLPGVFYEYAAIATVADVVDLTGYNRILVREGLKRLAHTENIGLAALISACEIADRETSAYHIGFVLGPCFNAAGRLGSSERATRLLQAQSMEEALQLAEGLKALNDSRKAMTEEGFESALAEIERGKLEANKVITVVIPNCHESIVGIIAGRLREKYCHPVIAFAETAEGLKGSGRSVDNYHMFDALNECRQYLQRFGGHAMAAGLSLAPENFDAFTRAINERCRLTEEDFTPSVRIDVAMPLGYITEKLIDELAMIEPSGKANAKPVFAQRGFTLLGARVLGKNKNVLRLNVRDAAGTAMDALIFANIEEFVAMVTNAFGAEAWERALAHRQSGIVLDLCYYPAVNEYMGSRLLQIIVSHYRPGTGELANADNQQK